MAIAVQSFKLQHVFSWMVTALCLLAAIAYVVTVPSTIDAAQGADLAQPAGWAQLLFRVLILSAVTAAAGWFAYAFSGNPADRREEQVKFSYFFVIASFAILTVPPFVKSQAIGSEPIGIVSGCVKGAEAAQLGCESAARPAQASDTGAGTGGPGSVPLTGQTAADDRNRNQWLVNIGGALSPQNAARCPPDAKTVCKVGSQDNRAFVSGGLVVPLPFVIIALFGGAISLSRRVPEIQKRSEPGYVGTPDAPALLAWEAREVLAFQILQFMSAPLIAIVAHQIVEPASQASAVALAFLAGFGSETILLMIRGIANGLQPKSITLQSPAGAPASKTSPVIQPGTGGGEAADGTGPASGAVAGAQPQQEALGQVKVPALETHAANIRLGIDVDSLDPGSVALTVNGASTVLPPDGLAELLLEIGRDYRLEASGRRNGQIVHGKLELKVTVDDEDSLHELTLA